MKILFYDVTAPFAYTGKSLTDQVVRGTEGSLIRIAEGLASKYQVTVAQHCRDVCHNETYAGVEYVSLSFARKMRPDIVILLRDHRYLQETAATFPDARLFFWMHNMPARHLFKLRGVLQPYEIIAVSHFHRKAIEKRLKGKWYQRLVSSSANVPVHVLYNPLADGLQPDGTPVKADQMIFTSSPYKGLQETLHLFAEIRKIYPEYQLLITANPDDIDCVLPENVHVTGALPHEQLMQKVKGSFCVFYPQTKRVETFGLVYAEANAVGTPVLAHDFGAAREVLSDSGQLIDGHALSAVLGKLKEWRAERPLLQAKQSFHLEKVLASWHRLINQR